MAQNYPEESTACVYPLDVRFIRATIGEWFQDFRKVTDLLTDLLQGKIRIQDVEPIHCVEKDGEYWAIDGNRRLFVYKVCF